MKGLELSRLYFERYGLPMLKARFAPYLGYLAAGLVGQGSECLGFDDEFSRDHDFGPGFCLWIPQSLAQELSGPLQEAYAALPQSIPECSASALNPQRGGRVGVHTIDGFYQSLIGRPDAPQTAMDWLRIPERFLSTAVNGAVFSDPLGQFSTIREVLLGFYPEDVVKKKVAANCALMAQAGQYNYPRSLRRRDFGAAYLACGEFIRAALGAMYLLSGVYMPFYKWAFRGARTLSGFSTPLADLQTLITLPEVSGGKQKEELIERICLSIAEALVQRGWSDRGDSFLQYHAEKVTSTIEDPAIRSLYLTVGGV